MLILYVDPVDSCLLVRPAISMEWSTLLELPANRSFQMVIGSFFSSFSSVELKPSFWWQHIFWCGLSLTVEKSVLLAFKGRRWYGMCAFNKTLVVRKCHLAPNPLGHIKYLRVIQGRTCIIRNHQRSGKFESELIDREISKRTFGQRQHLTLMKMPLQIIVA